MKTLENKALMIPDENLQKRLDNALPKEVVKSFPDTDYFDVTVKDRKIVLMPVRITPVDATLALVRDKMEKLGIKEKDVTEAIAWARKRRE